MEAGLMADLGDKVSALEIELEDVRSEFSDMEDELLEAQVYIGELEHDLSSAREEIESIPVIEYETITEMVFEADGRKMEGSDVGGWLLARLRGIVNSYG
jgi:chromosome segregation ATPase